MLRQIDNLTMLRQIDNLTMLRQIDNLTMLRQIDNLLMTTNFAVCHLFFKSRLHELMGKV